MVLRSLVLCTLFLAAMGYEFGKREVDNWWEERNDSLSEAAKEHEWGVGLFLLRALDRAGGPDSSGIRYCFEIPILFFDPFKVLV